ncbi:hypothetical protein N9V23_01825 [Flavobacteriales bacterium]|nr:hypothetical protein [Flavobacteriales bacterium]
MITKLRLRFMAMAMFISVCGAFAQDASPVPTEDAATVLSIFSDAYTNLEGTDFNPGWGQATTVEVSEVLTYTGLNYQGTQFANLNVSAYTYLHVDYYVTASTGLNFFLIGGGETPVALDVSTVGEWVSVEIPLTDFTAVNLADVYQFKVDGNGDVSFDNLYFGGKQAGVPGCMDSSASNYDAAANEDDGSCIVATVPDAPVPTEDAASVLSVFGATYGNLDGTDFNPGWGQATSVVVGDELEYSNLNYQGTAFPAQDVSGYGYIHVDYYTTNSTALNFFLIGDGETPVALDVTNTGVWNSVDIPLSSYSSVVNLANVIQFKVDGNGDVLFDNLYFGGTPPTVSGCTDATALNYNAAATESDDSCTYPDPCADLVKHFNIEGEVASAMYLKVLRTGANTVDVSAVSATNDPMDLLQIHALPAGATASEAVIVDGTATVTLTWADGAPATSTFEIHWSKVTMGGNWLLRTGDQPEINTADACGGTLSGCTDAAATNYWSLATEDDGSCQLPASGCTNSAATNYDAAATEDDGSCVIPAMTASPVPTEDAGTVLSIFSDAYTNLEGTDFNPGWGQATTVEVSEVLTYTGLNYQGTQFANQNVSAYTYLHVDYYVTASTALNFFLIGDGETPVALDVSTPGQWVSVEIPLTDFTAVNLANVHQFKVDGNGDVSFDNLYFGGKQAGVPGCTDSAASNYDAAANEDDGSCIIATVPDAPVPTEDAASVLSVFGATYGNLEGTDFNPGWGQATSVVVGDELEYSNLNYQGTAFPAQDVSGYGYIHVDYYTTNSTALNFFLIGDGETPVALDVTNTGVWNSVDIPLSSYSSVVNLANVIQFKVDGNGDVLFDNLYFGGTPPTVSGCTDATALNYNAAATESDDSCTYPDPCADLVKHLNIEGEVASAMYLKVLRTGANTVDVSAVSATNDPMDLLQIHALPAGATASEAVIVDGTATVTLTWADGAPATSTFEVHWSKVTMGGNWLLRTGDQPEINTANTCGEDLDGCTDASASNYDADAIVPATDADGNSLCTYDACSDVPTAGCIYFESFASFTETFGKDECDADGGESCVLGCTDAAADNYNADAAIDDESCTYPPVTVNVTFQVDMSAVETHAEGVFIAGGAFGQDGHLLTDNGSDVWSVTLPLEINQQYTYKFRNQPSFGTWDGFEDPSGLIAGECNTGQYNDRYVDVAEADITLDVVAYGSCDQTAPPVYGCMDSSADNYNAYATEDDGSCITVTIPASEVPTEAAEGVLSIFSNAYTDVAETNFNPGWGQATQVTVTDVLTYSGLNYQGTEFPSQDVSGYGYVNVDFYTEDATELSFTIISPGQEKLIPLTVTANQWNSVEIPLTDYSNVNLADVFQFKVTGNGTVHLDNLYFAGEAPAAVLGCTDAAAENFSAEASEDDGTCTYNTTAYCGTSIKHLGIDAETASEILLSISKSGDNTAVISAISTSADLVDFILVDPFQGSTNGAATIADGVASVTLTWNDGVPAIGEFIIQWSKESTPGNWIVRQDVVSNVDLLNPCPAGPVTLKGCTDDTATNYWASATEDDGSCEYPAATTSVTFQVDMSAVQTHEQGVYIAGGGFGQEGHLLTDNGSDVWSITLELDQNTQHTYKFRNQPAFGSWDGFEEATGLIAGGCVVGQYNDRFVDVGEEESIILDVVLYGSCTTEAPGVAGCLDENATNYNANATVQEIDGNGNIVCIYASCDDIPDEEGCRYDDSYNVFSESFDAAACEQWGEACVNGVIGCTDSSATNYDASATVDAGCEYAPLVLPIDFESTVNMVTFGGDDASATTVADPVSADNQVGQIIRNGGDMWQGAKIVVDTLDFESLSTITMKVYTEAPVGTTVKFKLEGIGAHEVDATTTVSGAWETLSWDFSGQPKSFDLVVLMFDFGNVGDGSNSSTFYFDDISQVDPNAPEGDCMDENASNYNADATVQAVDENNNTNCLYDSCDDIPSYGCIYADGFGAFHSDFNASACTEYGGQACEEPEVEGCTDENASNYDATVNTDDGSCTYDSCDDVPEGGCIHSNGTFEAWNGDFTAESDFCITYGGSECIVGCLDEKATDYNAEASIQGTDADNNILCTYASCADTPNLGCVYESSFGQYSEGFGPDQCALLDGATACLESAAGCTDENAVDFDASATEQALDANGNILCQYASCDDVPEDGCIYSPDSDRYEVYHFGAYDEDFGHVRCEEYEGTPCGLNEVIIPGGCIDPLASNFDAQVDSAGFDSFGNSLCIYSLQDGTADCDAIPDAAGCVYTGGYATYHADFNETQCKANGGTTCTKSTAGCMEETASNYNPDATEQTTDQYGNLLCLFDSCDDIPDAEGCIYVDDNNNPVSYATFRPGEFSAADCVTYGGIACEAPTTGPTSQSIDLPSGWSMFSSYIVPSSVSFEDMLSPIIDSVIIAKDNNGNAYLVEYNFNGIGNMTVGQGYQIKTKSEVTLTLDGAYANPEEHSIAIAAGWNMIGYLLVEAKSAADVLADMNASGNLIIAKDYNGNAYLPEYNFNGIGDMHPGQGYQLKTNNADDLSYATAAERSASKSVMLDEVKHFEKPSITDNNMTVVIEDAAWDAIPADGSEVAAYDHAGNLIGSAVYSSPVTVLSVWGDDATTSAKDGLSNAEVAKFKVWNAEDVKDFNVKNWSKGSAAYTTNAINVASSITTINAMAELNSSSSRELVKVVNILGQEVSNNDVSFVGTVFFNIYDDGSVEKIVK